MPHSVFMALWFVLLIKGPVVCEIMREMTHESRRTAWLSNIRPSLTQFNTHPHGPGQNLRQASTHVQIFGSNSKVPRQIRVTIIMCVRQACSVIQTHHFERRLKYYAYAKTPVKRATQIPTPLCHPRSGLDKHCSSPAHC